MCKRLLPASHSSHANETKQNTPDQVLDACRWRASRARCCMEISVHRLRSWLRARACRLSRLSATRPIAASRDPLAERDICKAAAHLHIHVGTRCVLRFTVSHITAHSRRHRDECMGLEARHHCYNRIPAGHYKGLMQNRCLARLLL